jgi:hypothetical protein
VNFGIDYLGLQGKTILHLAISFPSLPDDVNLESNPHLAKTCVQRCLEKRVLFHAELV